MEGGREEGSKVGRDAGKEGGREEGSKVGRDAGKEGGRLGRMGTEG